MLFVTSFTSFLNNLPHYQYGKSLNPRSIAIVTRNTIELLKNCFAFLLHLHTGVTYKSEWGSVDRLTAHIIIIWYILIINTTSNSNP